MKNFFILVTLLLISSCTLFINNLSRNKLKFKIPEPKICHLQDDYLFIGEDSSLIKVFQENYKSWKFTDKEMIYAWALANSIVRPDMINSNSFGGVFFIKDNTIKFLHGENFKKTNFNKILLKLDKILPKKIKISQAFAAKISKIKEINGRVPDRYRVANQILGKGEIYRRGDLKLTSIFKNKSNLPKKSSEFYNFQCQSFQNKVQKIPSETSILAIYHKKWQAIIVHSNVTSKNLLKPKFELPDISVCHKKNKYYANSYISYFDSGHKTLLNNLFNLGIDKIQNIGDLIYYINYPRFVLDKRSKYILLESLKADKILENYINTLNIPIYHKNNIGKIQSFYQFKKNNQLGFLLDPREPSILMCSNYD